MLFKGTISKIHPVQYGKDGPFIRLEFQMQNKNWAKTDLVLSFRNYQRWKEYLKVGMALDKLKMRHNGEVDADSYPEPIVAKKTGRWVETPNGMRFEVDRSFADDIGEMVAQVSQETAKLFQPRLFKV